MNETDLFNKDAMYWREVNFSLPAQLAEIELIESISFEGKAVKKIICSLLPFETHMVEYDLESGGSFMKNEVKAWPYVLLQDFDFYNDLANSQAERKSKLLSIPHSNVKSISVMDNSGTVILKKERA